MYERVVQTCTTAENPNTEINIGCHEENGSEFTHNQFQFNPNGFRFFFSLFLEGEFACTC